MSAEAGGPGNAGGRRLSHRPGVVRLSPARVGSPGQRRPRGARAGLAGTVRSVAGSPWAPCSGQQHARHLVELCALDVPGDDTGVKFLPGIWSWPVKTFSFSLLF